MAASIVFELGRMQSQPYVLNPDLIPVKYNRNRLVVNSKLMAAGAWHTDKFFAGYRASWKQFWKLRVELKQLQLTLRRFRQFFGPDCFETGILKPTSAFYRQIVSCLRFRKNWNELSPGKRATINHIHSDEVIPYLMNSHPMGKVIKDHFMALLSFQQSLEANRGSVQWFGRDTRLFDNILNNIPLFDNYLLGLKRLSKTALARLYGQGVRESKVALWNLLYNTPRIRYHVHFTSRVRLSAQVTLRDVFVWIPYLSTSGKYPRFRDPVTIREHNGYPIIHQASQLNMDQLLVTLYQTWYDQNRPEEVRLESFAAFVRRMTKGRK